MTSKVSNSSLALATLGGVLLGAAIGAALTAVTFRRGSQGDTDEENPSNPTTSPGKNKSRSLDFAGSGKGPRGSTSEAYDTAALTTTRDYDDGTHVNFLSDIMSRLWPYINRAGSEMIRTTVEPMFADMMPGPMKSLKFTKVDLGSIPMVLDNVIVHDLNPHDGSLQFDWDVTWHSSSDIQMAADYGVAFGVKTISLKGRMSFSLKPLSNDIPCFDAISYSFINPPELELDFTGLANFADFSLAAKMIRKILDDILASMMVLPIRMMYKMNPSSDFGDIYTPFKGVARVKLHRGRGFQVEKRTLGSHDVPDIYCIIQLGCEEPWKTPTIKNNLSPVWVDVSHDFVLMDNDQIVNVDIYDEDSGAMDGDDFLGRCHVSVARLLLAPNRTLELEVCHKKPKGNWKPTGSFVTLSVDILPFSGLSHSSLKATKKTKNEGSEMTGLLTILVNQAYNLPVARGEAQSFVRVVYGNITTDTGDSFKELGVTGVVTDLPGCDPLNPLYEMPFHLPLSGSTLDMSKKQPDVKLQLLNKTELLGEIIITHEELLKAENGTIREKKHPIGKGGASLSFAVTLAGVIGTKDEPTVVGSGPTATSQAATVPAAASTTASIGNADSSSRKGGTVRVVLVKAFGFQVRRKRGPFKKNDVPDIYCVIRFGSDPQAWRSTTVKDSITPTWTTESRDYPYTSPDQAINVDVYDENRRGKDDFCGTARTTVGKVLLNGGGRLDVEVIQDGKRTGRFVTVGCSML
jgi:hypothetical protein